MSARGVSRVLMTADAVGGVWIYALDLASGLASGGIDVALAIMGPAPDPAARAEAERIPGLELFHCDCKLEWMDDPWNDVRAAADWLAGLCGRVLPDVIHLNGFVHAAGLWPVPVVVAGHSCMLSWWRAVKREAPPASLERYRAEVFRGLSAAHTVVCPSHAMLHALEENYAGAIRRSVVIPNGRAPESFEPARKEPFILSVGRLWDEAKNIGTLDRTAAGLPWPVYVAGDERRPDGSIAEFRNVRRLGRLDSHQLARYYGQASIYALPARYEPFGLSVLEAALSGCALVLGDIPSLRENWEGAAVFVPAEDSERQAKAIRALIHSPALLQQMSEAARKRAAGFSVAQMSSRYSDLYARVTAGEALCAS